MDNVIKCLRSISDKELCYSEEGIRLINLAQEMIARERQVVLQEKNIFAFSSTRMGRYGGWVAQMVIRRPAVVPGALRSVIRAPKSKRVLK